MLCCVVPLQASVSGDAIRACMVPLWLSPQLMSVCRPAGEVCTLSLSLCAWLRISAEDRPANLSISWTSYMTLFATQHSLEPLEASLWAWMRALLRPLASASTLSRSAWSLPDSFMMHHVHVPRWDGCLPAA